jgi:16S rRNA (adenine1518-N6/adenine1519-N6)-dimethyltransferase
LDKLLDVPPESFRPAPKVHSAIVRMIPFPKHAIQVEDEKIFADIVLAAFGQRRKTLRNTLRGLISESEFDHLDINPGLRAENLGHWEFAKLSNLISYRQKLK